jgi:hypothetical protein
VLFQRHLQNSGLALRCSLVLPPATAILIMIPGHGSVCDCVDEKMSLRMQFEGGRKRGENSERGQMAGT